MLICHPLFMFFEVVLRRNGDGTDDFRKITIQFEKILWEKWMVEVFLAG